MTTNPRLDFSTRRDSTVPRLAAVPVESRSSANSVSDRTGDSAEDGGSANLTEVFRQSTLIRLRSGSCSIQAESLVSLLVRPSQLYPARAPHQANNNRGDPGVAYHAAPIADIIQHAFDLLADDDA